MCGAMRINEWTVDDSIAYWRAALDEAVDPMDQKVCRSKLYDAVVAKDRQQLEPLLRVYSERFGGCPDGWQQLIRAGLLSQEPLDLFGNPYGVDPARCALVAVKRIKDQ